MKKNVLFYTNIAVCVVILLGFAVSYFISHSSVLKMLEDDIEKLSEMTSENIYSKIESMLGRPTNVSLAMANNTFLYANKEKMKAQ